MMWEYKKVKSRHKLSEHTLNNEYGCFGWELCLVTNNATFTDYTYYFKKCNISLENYEIFGTENKDAVFLLKKGADVEHIESLIQQLKNKVAYIKKQK